MNALEPPDLHHLRAASGWLLLGSDVEAAEDLKRIDPKLHSHPDVLEVRWQIHAMAQNWDACLSIASAIVEIDPNRPSGWIGRAYSLRQIPAVASRRKVPCRTYDSLWFGVLCLSDGRLGRRPLLVA